MEPFLAVLENSSPPCVPTSHSPCTPSPHFGFVIHSGRALHPAAADAAVHRTSTASPASMPAF